MRHDRLSICAAVALTVIGATAGPAGSQDAEILVEAVPSGAVVDGESELRDVETLIGIPVYNALDEEIAEIDSLLVQGGSIVYARLKVGGFLLFGGEQITVPFSVLSFRETERAEREPTLQAVIETVRTTDQLRALFGSGPIKPGEAID